MAAPGTALEPEALTRKLRIDAALRESGWHIVPHLPGTPFASYHHAAVTEFPTANGPATPIASAIEREWPGVLHAWIPSQPISAHRVSGATQRPRSLRKNDRSQAQRYACGIQQLDLWYGENGFPFRFTTNGQTIRSLDARDAANTAR